MKRMKKVTHIVDFLFPLTLFGVFAFCALAVVLIGSSVYKKTVASMDAHYNLNTSLSYVVEKIRQNDTQGSVSAENQSGIPVLILEQTYNDTPYCTYIYAQEGHLKELFTKKESGFNPDDGESIMEISTFDITQIDDGLFHLTTADHDGNQVSTCLSQRSVQRNKE